MKFSRFFPFILLSIGLAACSLASDITPPPGYRSPTPAPTRPPAQAAFPAVPPNPANGAALFVEKCAPCHGEAGLGDGPKAVTLQQQGITVPALGRPEIGRAATPAEWYDIVTNGNMQAFMPPFSSLSEAQRWDVVAYALSLSTSPEEIATGQSLYSTYCARCHGESGRGDGPDGAGVAFTQPKFMAGLSGTAIYAALINGKGSMPGFGEKLNEEERWQLAAYVRSLSFATGTAASQLTPPPLVEVTPGVVASPAITQTGLLSAPVSGIITHADGGTVPAQLPVTLYAFEVGQQSMELVYSRTVTATNGTFTFDDIDLPMGRVFGAAVEYQGALYGSSVTTVETDTVSLELPITIYDSTADASALVVERLHLILDFSLQNQVQVMEMYAISNPTTRTIVAPAEGQPVATFPLPQGATNLQFTDGTLGKRYLLTPNGFADTEAVYPGNSSYQLSFTFDLPYPQALAFSQELPFATRAVTVLFPDGVVSLTSDQLMDGGLYQGTEYRRYDGADFEAGHRLEMTLSGAPASATAQNAAGTGEGEARRNLLVGLAAAGLVLILLGVWVYRRGETRPVQTSGGPQVTSSAPPVTLPPEDPGGLMDAIIALDDQFRAGSLPEAAYRQRRAELKARLSEILDDK